MTQCCLNNVQVQKYPTHELVSYFGGDPCISVSVWKGHHASMCTYSWMLRRRKLVSYGRGNKCSPCVNWLWWRVPNMSWLVIVVNGSPVNWLFASVVVGGRQCAWTLPTHKLASYSGGASCINVAHTQQCFSAKSHQESMVVKTWMLPMNECDLVMVVGIHTSIFKCIKWGPSTPSMTNKFICGQRFACGQHSCAHKLPMSNINGILTLPDIYTSWVFTSEHTSWTVWSPVFIYNGRWQWSKCTKWGYTQCTWNSGRKCWK